MIGYRKSRGLRVTRATAPEPPFWAATTVAPYGARRSEPLAIDYLTLQASAADKLEVTVCAAVRDELERAAQRHHFHAPLLIDATGAAETEFGCGAEAAAFCAANAIEPLFLISSEGTVPAALPEGAVLAISSWQLDLERIEPLFAEARDRGYRWGVAVPVIFPVSTELTGLAELADLAAERGASFLAALPVDVDPTARQALARSLMLGDTDEDGETYAALFHSDLETIHVATERHIAALAGERSLADFVVPPLADARSNWNAAVLLTLVASRMLAMKREVELAWALWRSAKVVAELDKPISRIAEAASLGIIDGVDPISEAMLTEWLRGVEPSFAARVAGEWRLRRDHGVA